MVFGTHTLRVVLREWEREIHESAQALAALRLIEATPSLRSRLHEKRAGWGQSVSDALRTRSDLDPFTADLLTNAASAALDTVSGEWHRNGAATDRAELVDRAFALLRPAH